MVKKHADVDKHYEHRDPRSSKSPEKNVKKTSISLKPHKSSQRQKKQHVGKKKKDTVGAGVPVARLAKTAFSAGALGLIPGLGRAPGEAKDPLQCSGLEKSMDRHGWDYIYIITLKEAYIQSQREGRDGEGGTGKGAAVHEGWRLRLWWWHAHTEADCNAVRVTDDVINQCCLSKIQVRRGQDCQTVF